MKPLSDERKLAACELIAASRDNVATHLLRANIKARRQDLKRIDRLEAALREARERFDSVLHWTHGGTEEFRIRSNIAGEAIAAINAALGEGNDVG